MSVHFKFKFLFFMMYHYTMGMADKGRLRSPPNTCVVLASKHYDIAIGVLYVYTSTCGYGDTKYM